MALTKVEICNLGLTRIGIKQLIDTYDEDTTEGILCRLYYDHALESCLEEADWPFATRRVELATVVEDPPDEWAYAYAWPSNCVRILQIKDDLQVRREDQRIPYRIEHDGTQRVILCNQEDAYALYIYLETTVTEFPAHFADALAWFLAKEMAWPMTQDTATEDRAAIGFLRAIARARGMSYEGEQPNPDPDSALIAARD